jgi:hypothetical protein
LSRGTFCRIIGKILFSTRKYWARPHGKMHFFVT